MIVVVNLSIKPTIVGELVILRPFEAADFPYIEEFLKDSEVTKLMGYSNYFNEEAVLYWYNTRNNQIDRLDLAIVEKSLNILIGEAVINLYDDQKQSMNFTIRIGPRGRNQGLGSEATQLMINHVFRFTRLKQITLSVLSFNPRAKKVFENAGFVLESVDKNALEYEGEWVDSINMVLTRAEWSRRTKWINSSIATL